MLISLIKGKYVNFFHTQARLPSVVYILMCFVKTIGKYMIKSEIAETWVESDILGPTATKHAPNGKAYQRATHAQN